MTQSTPITTRVERAIFDLRRGWPVVLYNAETACVVMSPETASREQLEAVMVWNGAVSPALLITPVRAQKLGLDTVGSRAVRIGLAAGFECSDIATLVHPTRDLQHDSSKLHLETPLALDPSAIQLMKLAFLLPAAVVQPLTLTREQVRDFANDHEYSMVSMGNIAEYREDIALSLEKVSEASVPLADAPDAKVMVFRPRSSSVEHLAIVVGDPARMAAPLVRIHSSCVTGDILGSLRCDCGDQLHAALQAMQAAGGGILLYLYQEGRGIGIANKMKAYALQDSGRDTVDANEEMGFDADERSFKAAAKMLATLGIKTVSLMTNNPDKMEELSQFGISVTQRVPLVIAPNRHNEKYLDTKAKRCGHLL